MTSQNFTSYSHIYLQDRNIRIVRWIYLLFISIASVLFLPWTQNIRAKGAVTTLRQEQRPQQVNTIIGGRVERWFVKEGDQVKKGDTIVLLSEIKTDYLDPNLLTRTSEQIDAKKSSVNFYKSKIAATENQIDALENTLEAKVDQLRKKLLQEQLKITADSMDFNAAINDNRIATIQFERQKALFDSGLVSLTQLEQRNQLYQSTLAKKTAAENKLLATRQQLNILQIEFGAIAQEYVEKVSKAQGDKFSSLSQVSSEQGEIAKLQNLNASYAIRNGMYYVLAPQNGQVIQAARSGIGEIVKEGEMLVHIVPDQLDYAVELYVRPVDLPLISTGQQVRFLFDGFPAIVFSGWPGASYGTYAGIVSAIENDVSGNGSFKVLVKEDTSYRKWPKQLKLGTGANGIALLKNVQLWYELWRNINSFPPDYYKPKQTKEK